MYYGTEIISFLGREVWGLVPKKIKSITNQAKNGHQKNVLEDFVKSMLVMSTYFSNFHKIYVSNCLEKELDNEYFPRRSSWSDTFYLYFLSAQNRPKSII